MKKALLLGAIGLIALGAQAQDAFDKGERKMSLTIGIGMVDYADKSRATFDQHFGMEWGIGKIADKFTIGVGFAVNNTYGATYSGLVVGKYDYHYTSTTITEVTNHNRKTTKTTYSDHHREGKGTAEANISRDDVNAMATASLHYTIMPKLDTYLTIGVGIGCENYVFSNYHNESGFSSADHKGDGKYPDVIYSYNDLDHVKWDGYDTKVSAAVATYIGATYYITDRWGVDAQFGLINSNLNKPYANSYGLFAIGATYKF